MFSYGGLNSAAAEGCRHRQDRTNCTNMKEQHGLKSELHPAEASLGELRIGFSDFRFPGLSGVLSCSCC